MTFEIILHLHSNGKVNKYKTFCAYLANSRLCAHLNIFILKYLSFGS